MTEPKKPGPMPSTVSGTPPPGTRTNAAAAKKYNDAIRAKHFALVAKREAGLHKMLSKAKSQQRWIDTVKYLGKHDPPFLNYLRKEFPKQVAEAERGIAAGKAASTPKVVPKPPAVRPRFGSPKIKAGIAFGAATIASLIPDIILLVADKEAAKEALRRIATKFLKEGAARGIAAGLMAWTDEEVQLNLKYKVTPFRVQNLHDPAGLLTRGDIFRLAEACENYAVDEGFQYSSRQPPDWKRAMREKGLSLLAKHGYTKWRRTEDPAVLFEFDFIDKLAWVLRPTTDSIVEPAIRLS